MIAIRLGRLLPVASSNLPGHLWQDHQYCSAVMPLHGLASDGVYLASSVTRVAVRSYRTFSPLPEHERTGGFFSVALSLRSPSLDVIQHPDPVKPGLSSGKDIPASSYPAICSPLSR